MKFKDNNKAVSEQSEATIANLKLIEVTIDQGTFASVPVEGGECFEIASAGWNTVHECDIATQATDCSDPTPVCHPDTFTCVGCVVNEDCAGEKLCNLDTFTCYDPECSTDADCSAPTPACDTSTRLCVECTANENCAEGQQCNPATFKCEALDLCTGISLGSFLQNPDSKNVHIATYDPDTGALDSQNNEVEDFFQLEIYADTFAPGTVDIMTGGNDNFETCDYCLRVIENATDATSRKDYFAQFGSIEIGYVGADNVSFGTISNLRLIEVTIDKTTFKSTPVEGGDCLHVETGAWNVTGETLCTTNADCSGDKAVCKTDPGWCVECLADGDCAEGTCDTGTNTCSTPTPTGGLIISEYIEGGASNKAIEVYNASSGEIDLSQYRLALYSNGSPTVINSLILSDCGVGNTTLAAGGVIVVMNASFDATVLGRATCTSEVTFFNGDDAVTLEKKVGDTWSNTPAEGSIVDIIGEVGTDPGSEWTWTDGETACSTLNKTLVKKDGVSEGSAVWDSTKWTCYPQDTFTYLGAHPGEFAPGK